MFFVLSAFIGVNRRPKTFLLYRRNSSIEGAASSRPSAIISTSCLDTANARVVNASRISVTATARVPSVFRFACVAMWFSDGGVALIAVADADGLRHFVDEDFAIADFAGARGDGQRGEHLGQAGVGNDHLHFH